MRWRRPTYGAPLKQRMPMPTIVRFKIPEKLHALEVGPDVFVFPEEATVGHWRAALKHWQNEGFIPHPREIKQMIKIADALGLSDDVVLLPHLKEFGVGRKEVPERSTDQTAGQKMTSLVELMLCCVQSSKGLAKGHV